MQLKSIEIRRTESYSTPANTLQGVVNLVDDQGGAMTIVLSPTAILKFTSLVVEEVTKRAQAQARSIPQAMEDAQGELLIQANPMLTVQPDDIPFA